MHAAPSLAFPDGMGDSWGELSGAPPADAVYPALMTHASAWRFPRGPHLRTAGPDEAPAGGGRALLVRTRPGSTLTRPRSVSACTS